MSRKEKMVTRTVEMTKVVLMAVHLDTAEVINVKGMLEGDWSEKPQRAILNRIEGLHMFSEERVRPVEVLDMKREVFKYIMPLSTFIDNATETIKIEETKEEI